jgi:hypothetical protein
MAGLGRSLLTNTSGDLRSIIAGDDVQWRTGGVTIDWATVSAAGSNTTLGDGTYIKAGQKYLAMGQVLARASVGAADVLTLNNTPTGGTFVVSVAAGGTTQSTTALAYNATAATVQTAVQLLTNVGTGLTVSGSAGGPYTFTAVSPFGPVTITSDGSLLTGAGSQPTATVAPTTATSGYGFFGPYDSGASDGRQTLVRGNCGIVPSTIVQDGILGLKLVDTDHRGVVVGGRVYIARVIQSGAGTASLAAGPTLAVLLAAMPTLTPVTLAS